MLRVLIVLLVATACSDSDLPEVELEVIEAPSPFLAEGERCDADAECEFGSCWDGVCAATCEVQLDCPGFNGAAPGTAACFEAGPEDICLTVCMDPAGRYLGCAEGSTCSFASLPDWWVCWPDAV